MTQAAPAHRVMRIGDRFGRWTILALQGEKAHCRCDCGTKREIFKHTLTQAGGSKSCGCLRREVSRELARDNLLTAEAQQKMAESIKRKWESGEYEAFRAAYSEWGRELAARKAGAPGTGQCAKGESNHIAKEWRLRTPAGDVVEFKSLRNWVRENASLFDAKDVEFRKNKFGTDLWCRADMGLRRLFAAKNPAKQWKGWTRA